MPDTSPDTTPATTPAAPAPAPAGMGENPRLFSPLTLGGVTLPNRVVISPMCQYAAVDGVATDWHFAHLSSFAMGGAGLIMVEATAVEQRGRISLGDLGIWTDEQAAALRPIVDFLRRCGSVPGIQIGHAGRKGGTQRPWHGNGPLGPADAARGEAPWTIVAPSALAYAEGAMVPAELSAAEMDGIRTRFVEAAGRALAAGFDVLELHGAHGYLLHSFLSPISNRRTDGYGGDRAGRMRYPLSVAEAVRAVWPADKPLFFRISAIDAVEEGGWELEDSVALAGELKARGVDVIDCSTGGIGGAATAAGVKRAPGFQVPFAEAVRRQVDIPTMAVGLILTPEQAEEILQAGQADLIAIGRQALFDPFWARHAAYALGVDRDFADWPDPYGWWLTRRERSLQR